MSFERIDRQFKPNRIALECAECEATEGVFMVPVRDGRVGEPPVARCPACAEIYNEFWDRMPDGS